ncbi:hypothetical protein G6F31_013733 [Rhizopus arrhizus]|nr:hypothetical protein G6F31_013733 [Rhizopus arrhizus]
MDRLTAMTVFVEVAERGSLTAAAEVLDMSRAMVSRYLAEVEGWLGARLLHRTTRRVSLTGPGEAALARFRQMLEIAARHAAGDRQRVVRAEPSGACSGRFRRAPPGGAHRAAAGRPHGKPGGRAGGPGGAYRAPDRPQPDRAAAGHLPLGAVRDALLPAGARHADRPRAPGRAQLPDPPLRRQEPVAAAPRRTFVVGGGGRQHQRQRGLAAAGGGTGRCRYRDAADLPGGAAATQWRADRTAAGIQPGRTRHSCRVRITAPAARYHAAIPGLPGRVFRQPGLPGPGLAPAGQGEHVNHGQALIDHNRAAWDRQASEVREWSRPVESSTIAAAREGRWQVHLTPRALPLDWLGDVRGRRILCLASGGGQQAPVLAAAGADVTVFDLSDGQLEQDRQVAARDGLQLRTVQGDMRDLHAFANGSFDVVFQPISNLA